MVVLISWFQMPLSIQYSNHCLRYFAIFALTVTYSWSQEHMGVASEGGTEHLLNCRQSLSNDYVEVLGHGPDNG